MTCLAISTQSSFDKTRDCLRDSDVAFDLFEKLRNSFVSQEALMKNLIQDLSGLTSETPHAKYQTTRNGMRDIMGDFKNVRYTMDTTFSVMEGYKTGWDTLSNCKIIRRELLLYNSGICFDFYPISYRFFLYLLTGLICLFIINWLLCIIERELTGEIVDPEEKEEEEEPLNDPKQESKDNIMGNEHDTEEVVLSQTLK